jgi:hypothetical protein
MLEPAGKSTTKVLPAFAEVAAACQLTDSHHRGELLHCQCVGVAAALNRGTALLPASMRPKHAHAL